ncbi:MAG: hypothetical protein HN742_33010 [Lentisphaerae bacterium]|jgi:hypothetical protein|nr:hypothetical protein [Lentisphaerota bacterium]MBT4822403.1 hypothetical protein [Lentisphaerota bacterium]MBT5608244.1 hypothetical protein [Lentisphaerota bacterium]MBT7061180.1 hypothetical protein [Lentisphaerota bacterium]MBT7846738.1 hypothetical protein [Lentisphaerota bacterium]
MNRNVLKIGWAQASITPEQPVNLFGMFNERISTHVEEPCLATALALEGADGEHALWISCDLVNCALDVVQDIRRAVAARIPGFDADKLLISCTHTHNAPNFRDDLFPEPPTGTMKPSEYRAFFVERVTDVAVAAWEARTPGQTSAGLGHAVLGWCRRVVFADGTGQMYGDAKRDDFVKVEGPMDPGVELLFTHDMDGVPTGAVVSIACTAQTCMGENFLTADIWGPTRRALREHFGNGFTVLAVTGAAGDQCPDDLIRWRRSEPARRGVEGCAVLARRLVNGVIEGFEHGRREMTDAPAFRHRHDLIELPAYVMSDEQVAYYEEQIRELTADGDPDPKSWGGGTLLRYRKLLERDAAARANPILVADCNFLRIGDLAVASNPFELYLEYGQRIKGRCPATQTIAAELTNDCLSYLPTREALAHGHYSAMPASLRVPPEGGDKLVERSVAILNEIFAQEP